MSIDYFFFVRTDDIGGILRAISEVEGVTLVDDTLEIEGLFYVQCMKLNPRHRQCMLREYGDYGLDVNWLITGTYDKDADIFVLMERLFRCAAAIVNAYPDAPMSLMWEGTLFYVFNTADRLLISPAYLKAMPMIPSLFDKPSTVSEFKYPGISGIS